MKLWDTLAEAAIVFVVIAGCFEWLVYSRWRRKLYEDYLDWDNRTRLPHVPEAWRRSNTYGKINFTLEWEILRARPDGMDAELLRRVRIERRVILWVYLPLCLLALWSLVETCIFKAR